MAIDPNLASIYKQVTDAFTANADAIVGSGNFELRYQGLVYDKEPDRNKYWAYVSTATVDTEQSTLSTSAGAEGQRRFTVSGIVMVQVFGPRNDPTSYYKVGDLARVAQRAYRVYRPVDNVWYKSAKVEPKVDLENWKYWVTSARFTYDEFV